jgi:Xaa-Pro dipeptidase
MPNIDYNDFDLRVFTHADLAVRQKQVQDKMTQQHIDVLLVSTPEDIFYLTGHQTPGYYCYQMLFIPVKGDPVILLRQLEQYNCAANSYLQNIEIYMDSANPATETVRLLERYNWSNKKIAIDETSHFFPVSIYKELIHKLDELVNGTGLVSAMRAIKSDFEIKQIELAAGYVDKGVLAGIANVNVGGTENDIVAAMMYSAIKAGSEYVGMEPLVTSGAKSGIPHSTWRRQKLAGGESCLLEMAASHNRYHAALMRTVWLGKPPQEAQAMMAICDEALNLLIATLKPGLNCFEAHAICQGIIDKAGYTNNFLKRAGYSMGISFAPDWGEGNVLSLYEGVNVRIMEGMIFHVPITLRKYGVFTVGVSEMVIVTANGCRTLSKIPRELIVL